MPHSLTQAAEVHSESIPRPMEDVRPSVNGFWQPREQRNQAAAIAFTDRHCTHAMLYVFEPGDDDEPRSMHESRYILLQASGGKHISTCAGLRIVMRMQIANGRWQKSGHPESNQGPSDSCNTLQSHALPTEL